MIDYYHNFFVISVITLISLVLISFAVIGLRGSPTLLHCVAVIFQTVGGCINCYFRPANTVLTHLDNVLERSQDIELGSIAAKTVPTVTVGPGAGTFPISVL